MYINIYIQLEGQVTESILNYKIINNANTSSAQWTSFHVASTCEDYYYYLNYLQILTWHRVD